MGQWPASLQSRTGNSYGAGKVGHGVWNVAFGFTVGGYCLSISVSFAAISINSGSFAVIWCPSAKILSYGSVVFRQFVIFYGLYTVLQLRCLLGAFVFVHADTVDLVSALGKLQQEACRVLAVPDPGLQPATSLMT